MNYIEVVGWIAAALTLVAYGMKTMLLFRISAVGANLAFLFYGYMADIYPTLFLHLLLLPFNGLRLYELLRVGGQVRAARLSDKIPEGLAAYLSPVTIGPDGYLFRKGDNADQIYYLKSGRIRLEEINKELDEGEIFGELAFFNASRTRTLSAICDGPCEVMGLSENEFTKLYFQNPAFGFFMLKLIVSRLEKATEA